MKLKFVTGAHLLNVLDTCFLCFFYNSKFSEIFFKTFFFEKKCHIYSFLSFEFEFEKIFGLSIMRHIMPKIAPSLKTVRGTTILAKHYFASKSIEHDVTLTSFPGDLDRYEIFILSGCVKLIYQKVLKVWCRYLYSFGRY